MWQIDHQDRPTYVTGEFEQINEVVGKKTKQNMNTFYGETIAKLKVGELPTLRKDLQPISLRQEEKKEVESFTCELYRFLRGNQLILLIGLYFIGK